MEGHVFSKLRLGAALALAVSMVFASVSVSAHHEGTDDYYPIETDEFETVWERTDLPVHELIVARTWMWSPAAHTPLLTEDYTEGEDGERDVQYFDKSRMEMPTEGDADADAESPWHITQGLLATELMTGNLQLGDEDFEEHQPSQRSAAGDPEDVTAPTYAAMGDLMDREPRAPGNEIVEHANREGVVIEDEARFGGTGITDVAGDWQDVEGIDHNIASVFWDFMNSETTIYDAELDDFVEGDLFLNAFYAVGYPTTDAFWADVMVEGDVQDVLIQCFERRCLTYTPGNPEGWEVESGNIGQHYYNWRYHEIDEVEPPVEVSGTFTFNGEDLARVEVDGTVVLTANVLENGQALEGADVEFRIGEDDEDIISIAPGEVQTDSEGNAVVTVTGLDTGVATVSAFVDVDAETDVELGSVQVIVGPIPPAEYQMTVSGPDDVEELETHWQVSIYLTDEDYPADPFHPGDAEVAGELTRILYERPDGTVIELGAEGTAHLYWAKPTDEAQYAEGTHTIYYEVEGEWFALTSEFDAEGQLIAVNSEPYEAPEENDDGNSNG